MKEIAVVTGGTKGIGKAIINKLANNGIDIFTCARDLVDLKDLKKDIEKSGKSKVNIMQADLSVKREVSKFAGFIGEQASQVDILINNAGIFIPGQLHTEEDGILEKTMDINLYGVYHLTRLLLPRMIKRKKGHIFTMCSTASIVPYVNGGSYCISKFALLGFSRVLREEMKEHNIRVTSIMPGATLTASWEGVDVPEERFMRASDVAEAVWNAYQLSGRTVLEEMILRPMLGDL